MQIQATLIDFDKVYNSINGLTNIEKDKTIKSALKGALSVFLNAGRSNLRARLKGNKTTGNLNKAFKTKVKRNSLGALSGFGALGMHSHLVDRGTVKRTTKSGRNRGVMPANNFWTDAIATNEGTAIAKVYEGIDRAVTRILLRN